MARRSNRNQSVAVFYGFATLAACSVWFLAIRAPLWLDETGSYWCIAAGFRNVWSRSVELNSFPAYYYILWLAKSLLGRSEVALRIPSVLAMLAAAYAFYRCARELFSWEVAAFATAVFALDERVVFAAIDVRPYAWALLITNVSIFMFLRWWKTNAPGYAVAVGLGCAAIFYFHYLFGCIAVAFVLCSLSEFRGRARQMAVASGIFALAMVPLIPRFWYLGKTGGAHVFSGEVDPTDLLQALFLGAAPFVLTGLVLTAAALQKLRTPNGNQWRRLTPCLSLALVPLLALYGVSAFTSLHIFVSRYEAVAVPGIALCWGWVLSLVDSSRLRVTGCLVLVVVAFIWQCGFKDPWQHGYSWKDALQYANSDSARDGSPLVICSDLPESNFEPMPEKPEQSALFSPLLYYGVQAPIVPLPRELNAQAENIGLSFLRRAAEKRQRFLVLAYRPSYSTVEWLEKTGSSDFDSREMGKFDGIELVEFRPRDGSVMQPAKPIPNW